ncbi:saccharopine dehydrogenase [Bailinhaonella thermotolerans]|uniref:Saccharopine dehydrogenase n=1 Tax=Bailinhaonella thermotolerans TaxID=1070861 RepID=A0A3A4BF00_9ACTN|nr:saccharopine dehydrogenase [Bailinhaonella thermotolerans]
MLILGGYGAVGRHAAAALAGRHDVVVAGRDPGRARPVPGSRTARVDAADPASLAAALDGTGTVLMCAERDNARVARACLERGIHYLDVSASHPTLDAIAGLDGLARERGSAAALSVGLAPGVTNLLARHVTERSGADRVRVAVLLGSGEHHGPAALAWTLDGLAGLGGSWRARFPAPYGERTVHRFPFSDQHTLPATLGLADAVTGLCLDSRAFTALLAAAGRPAAARLLRRPRVRAALLSALAGVHVGGDGFAVTVEAGGAGASFSGRLQSRATGLAAALLAERLPLLPPGVSHIERLVDPVPFLTELAGHGFDLDLPR